MGCDADLPVGAVVISGPTRMTIIARATEQQACDSAERLGMGPLVIAPGERFYEIETSLAPVCAN
jgi:hypothetical protein